MRFKKSNCRKKTVFSHPDVSGLCDGGAIEAQIFNFAQKLNRRTTVELCSFAPLLQNPC